MMTFKIGSIAASLLLVAVFGFAIASNPPSNASSDSTGFCCCGPECDCDDCQCRCVDSACACQSCYCTGSSGCDCGDTSRDCEPGKCDCAPAKALK